jgi:hypothetical protein
LRDAFDREKPDPTWTDQQMFEQEALGRSMFYNKVHGACTSSSVYLATIFRALGIPTRIVFCIPPFDPNDDAQARMFYDNIHHNQVRETVRLRSMARAALKTTCSTKFMLIIAGFGSITKPWDSRSWMRIILDS